MSEPEWWSAVQSLTEKVGALNEKIEGPRGLRQDVNAAHGIVRKSRAITWQDVGVMALVAIICDILVLWIATVIPSIHLGH